VSAKGGKLMSDGAFHPRTEPVGVRERTGRHCLGRVRPRGAPAVAIGVLGAALGLAPWSRAADGREAGPDLETRPSSLPPAAPTERPPADIVLVWYDPLEALPAGRDVMARETRTIFAGVGVRVSWRDGDGGTFGEGPTPEFAVILLPDDPAPARAQQRIMGLTLKKQGPSRSMWLFLSNVRWTLGLDPRRMAPPADLEWEDVGRALGRVLAHELIHAILPDEPHAARGLMNHSLDRRFLLRRAVTVDRRSARVLRARLGIAPAAGGLAESASLSGP